MLKVAKIEAMTQLVDGREPGDHVVFACESRIIRVEHDIEYNFPQYQVAGHGVQVEAIIDKNEIDHMDEGMCLLLRLRIMRLRNSQY